MSMLKDIIYYVKYIVTYIYIRVYNACHGRRFDLYDINATGDPIKLGFVIPQIEKDLESPLPESQLQKTTDEVFFYGVNSKSEFLLVRIARGPNQVAEAWIHLRLSNGKTYQLAETNGYQQPFEKKCLSFSCGRLQMQYLSPMRRWRIFYSGMLTETSSNQRNAESIFVKFIFLWKASSDVYDLTVDRDSKGLATALARSNWKNPFVPPLKNFAETMNFYAQSGVIDGTVSINGGEEYEMYLFGEKTRNIGKIENISDYKFDSVLGSTPLHGLTFHFGQVTVPNLFQNLLYGFIVDKSGSMETVKKLKLDIKRSSQCTTKNDIEAKFQTREKHEVTGTSLSKPILLSSGEEWIGSVELSFIEFNLDNKKGSGVIMSGRIHKRTKRNLLEATPIVEFPNTIPLTVQFGDDICISAEISGGKGSSLGKLTQLSRKNETFIVPKGIVLTTAAYKEFLTPEITNAVEKLENIVYGKEEGDIKATCTSVSNIIKKTLLAEEICQAISENLKASFGDEANSRKFAVRSSATGEDTDAMSAAGQMETFLGIQGLNEVFLAVKKCWASQFNYKAIEYKRQNGQVLNSPMAVVIQEMVDCEVSGVIFTCDPVTNNPSFITIAANYGLGESVVSGSVEPDTVSLRRKNNDELELDSVTIGSKHQKTVMHESGGIVTQDVSENSKESQSCLTEEMVMLLGKLAIEIETFFKSSRDIEWGILKKKIHIFQSRPITKAAGETDYEIKHEFDAPLRNEREFFTIANVGEVMPGATSPLGMEIIVKLMGIAIKKRDRRGESSNNYIQSNYFPNGLLHFYNRMMLNPVGFLLRHGIDYPRTKGIQISLFGRILDDPELLKYAREMNVQHTPPSLTKMVKHYLDLFWHNNGIDKMKKRLGKYKMKYLKAKSAEDAFNGLMNAFSEFDGYSDKHIQCTACSSSWNMHVFLILYKAKGEFDNNVYSDFARLMASLSNVESAEVPQAMQNLALRIRDEIDSETFKSMTVENAEEWLLTSPTAAGYKFRQFLKKHGHRCLQEFDIRTITWGMDPKPLVKILQSMVNSCKDTETRKDRDYDEMLSVLSAPLGFWPKLMLKLFFPFCYNGLRGTKSYKRVVNAWKFTAKKKDRDYEKMLSELNTPLGFWSKLILKFILPYCYNGVRGRESSKSLIIKALYYLRQGYRHLAKLMVSEGRIPDANLIFFLTLIEIEDLLKTRSPNIISRAVCRRKLFPTLNQYKFPEIMQGLPKPMNMKNESAENYEYIADLTMKGFPVSQGVAKGFARVVLSLEEASHLKRGEILITHSTDIGWSPYFPIVSGVVTELGGLISHGAVVSREYGLPCIVGLKGATKMFKTGDYVLLDGKKGVLQRLPKPEI